CSICLDVFSSPVSTPCGHNFCRTCVTKYWDDRVWYNCPVCNELFQTRPFLRVNTLLSELAAQFRTSVRVEEQPCVEPAEVPCDVCTGTQLKAVKSCLVCLISFCQTHLEPHQRVEVLKKHRLVEPMDRLEDRMCKKHDRLLELFCQTEQVCVCQFCTETDHKSHPVVPLKEEYEVKTAKLGKIEAEVQQMIQERQKNIHEIKDTVKRSKADADREIADGVQVITALMRCIEKCLIKELEQEKEDLTNRTSEVKQLSHTKTHSGPEHRHLFLCEDNRKVMQLGITQRYPDHPERFDYRRQVLCREGLTGRCYWEVDWQGEVDIGVTYRGITRRGRRDDSLIGQNHMSWCLHGEDANDVDNVYSSWYNGNETILSPPPPITLKE
ncbi:E3 ubiquitin-protein ligase TRIM47-like, partial [Gadus chalcogrammus]|uniref:E3 ubiquitin-protein ligase TRIM47-like n=1 Tax=Gadus chalcogrammus TaxID=1042646 RepID=UPI0024C42737